MIKWGIKELVLVGFRRVDEAINDKTMRSYDRMQRMENSMVKRVFESELSDGKGG